MNNNDALRLARIEAVVNQLRSEMDDVMAKTYETACADGNEEVAADLVRRMRNKLLMESDKEMALDRSLPPVPSGTTFSAWLVWLKALAGVTKNDWAKYRQKLRDIPTQEGFPFHVIFPDKPEENKED